MENRIKELEELLAEKSAALTTLARNLLLFMEYARSNNQFGYGVFTALEGKGKLSESGPVTIQYEDGLSGYTWGGNNDTLHTIVIVPRETPIDPLADLRTVAK